jgi:hypothetical protein
LRHGAIATLVFSGALAAGAGALWIAGARRASRIEEACAGGCSQAFVDHEVDRSNIRNMELGFNLLAGSASVVLATSISIWVLRGRERRQSSSLRIGARSVTFARHF